MLSLVFQEEVQHVRLPEMNELLKHVLAALYSTGRCYS